MPQKTWRQAEVQKLIKVVLQVKRKQAQIRQRRKQRLQAILGSVENLGLSSESEGGELAAGDDDLDLSDQEMSSSLSSDLSADKSDSSIAMDSPSVTRGEVGHTQSGSDVSNLPASFSSVSSMDTSVDASDLELELSDSDDSGVDADDESEESDDESMPPTHQPSLHHFTCRFI